MSGSIDNQSSLESPEFRAISSESLSDPVLSDSASSVTGSNAGSSSRKRKRKTKTPDSSIEAGKKRVESTAKDGTICQDCYKIDFQKALGLDSTALANAKGVLIMDLGNRLSRSSLNSCALCRLLGEAAGTWMAGDKQIELEIRAFSVLRFSYKIQYKYCPKDLKPSDQPYLAVVPRESIGPDIMYTANEVGYIFCRSLLRQPTSIFTPQIIPRYVDFSLLQHWLGYCRARHKRLCGDTGAQLSNLRVIDCSTLSIVSAPPSCRYAALSYVWSQRNRELQVVEQVQTVLHLQNLPRIVQDAITATQQLGFQYLWVDRFCIDQEHPHEKHHQIQNMDTVYRGAELTIIAAAGLDENSGLPGVGTIPRASQLTATVHDVQIISTGIHPHLSVARSTWSTRGWTYQEAVLSRRRIVFTDHQVYFECNAMNCQESLEGDLDVLHTKNKHKSLKMLHNGIFAGREKQCFGPSDMENITLEASWDRYLNLITNYSSKALTFESDSLSAFMGIAGHLTRSRYPLFNLLGLPFPPPRLVRGASEDRKYFSMGLLWFHRADSDQSPKRVSRRPAFPSWSWVGWEGEVHFPDVMVSLITEYDCEIKKVYFEFAPDCLVEQSYLLRHSALEELQIRSPRGLQLDVLIASSTLLTISDAKSHTWQLRGKEAILSLSVFVTGNPDDPLPVLEKFRKREWILILIGCYEGLVKPVTYFMIVAQHIAFMSRIGIIEVRGLRRRDIPPEDLTPGRIRIL